jgi:fructosamine-3-kinase
MERLPGVCLGGLNLEPADRADIEAELAGALAELHSHTGTRWGGIGTADQSAGWAELFGARLAEAGAQPALAERLAPDVLLRIDDAIELARPALRDPGRPTLVHGDVWDGNMMVDQDDGHWRLAGLLDPDLQYADVEFELAYLEVFDVSREEFFAAYTEYHPLRPGYDYRRLFYWLHTGLVHVALFGDDFFRKYTARTAEVICRWEAP